MTPPELDKAIELAIRLGHQKGIRDTESGKEIEPLEDFIRVRTEDIKKLLESGT